jgi:hypothetical protein
MSDLVHVHQLNFKVSQTAKSFFPFVIMGLKIEAKNTCGQKEVVHESRRNSPAALVQQTTCLSLFVDETLQF